MLTRRAILKLGAAGGAGFYAGSKLGLVSRALAHVSGGTLPHDVIPKFVTPFVFPPAMHWANPPGGVAGRDMRGTQ
jgi:hypothetical protein